jgi:(1->4)-alpha-D-glucan 1-alpha-D-glucosylmutase
MLRALSGVAQSNVSTRDWSTEVIARVLDLVLQKFPVYRSYVENGQRDETDQAWFGPLLEAVRVELDRRRDAAGIQLLPVLDGWLAAAGASSENSPAALALQRRAIRRFEQLTPPLAAKSLEDTTFYRYGRLLSRNEVGSDPAVFALSVDEFHQRNATRVKQGAKSMLATATHDHKRGEDVRARLAVLTEVAPMWIECTRRWLDETHAAGESTSATHASERYMLLQMVVGAWPLELSADDEAGRAAYADRLIQWQQKALREGKQSSSWFDPDLQHEEASADYLRALLTGAGPGPYREIAKFVDTIALAAAVNSLTQAVLRMTSPGIPDLYQGTEFWDFSLVDPDNRRPVDFALRHKALQTYLRDSDINELLTGWRNGRIKQFVVFRTLQMLRAATGLFRNGDYLPLPVTGIRSEHAMAYARRLGDEDVVVVVPRLIFSGIDHQSGDTRPVISAQFWADSTVSMPPRSNPGQWLNIFNDTMHTTEAGGTLRLADVFAGLPVAILRST